MIALPEKWDSLPYALREYIIGQCELEYDPYEGSRSEAADILLYGHGNEFDDNWKVVQSYYKGLTENDPDANIIKQIVRGQINGLQSQIVDLQQYL